MAGRESVCCLDVLRDRRFFKKLEILWTNRDKVGTWSGQGRDLNSGPPNFDWKTIAITARPNSFLAVNAGLNSAMGPRLTKLFLPAFNDKNNCKRFRKRFNLLLKFPLSKTGNLRFTDFRLFFFNNRTFYFW